MFFFLVNNVLQLTIMRSTSSDAGSDEVVSSEPRTEEKRLKKGKRSLLRYRVGPGTAALKADKKNEDEMFNSTVVVTSSPPPFDADELRTPTNIQLREEVFVHYPSSALDSPVSATAAEVAAADTQSRSLALQPSLRPCASGAGEPSHHGPIQHEQDHDCCPFTAIRRSEWTLRTVAKMRRTSPFDWSYLLTSFSVKNAFMFYPPPPTYGFFRDEDGGIQVRSQTGKRAPRLDHERIEYLRRKCRFSDKVPDDLVGGALHGIAGANQQDHGGGGSDDDSEPSFKLIFIPWENDVQSYYIRDGAVMFGRRVRMGRPLFALAWPCPIPCSIIRPHRRMSSHVCIFFHCNGEDIGRPSCLRLLTLANALHMTILVPEYPGYGLFEGSPSEASIKGAMERVVEFLFASDPSFTPSRLILMGHSIGTGVAIHVAKFIKRIFLKLHDSPDLNRQVPYACPMSRNHGNLAEFGATLQCPPNSFVTPFSAEPAAPPPRRSASQLREFSPFNALLRSSAADGGDSGRRASNEAAEETTVTGAGQNAAHTPLHAPYGKSGGDGARRRSGARGTPAFFCPHYALGGVILLAPFASVRCVEKWNTLKHHGFNLQELERRRLSVPEDVLVPAPEEWAEDAGELHGTGADTPSMEFLRPSPLLFDLASHVSFNRFLTIDVVRELQDEVGFFTYTPLLLLHGAQDVLIPPINSVAIASKLRQATGGRTTKVYLGFLHDEGHNNLHCSHIIRRFYKDVILLPHLRAEQELREELEETLRNGLGTSNVTDSGDRPAVTEPLADSASIAHKATVGPPPVPPTAATAATEGAGNGVSAEPHVFEVTPRRAPPPQCTSTTPTNRSTEPFDEEQPELPPSDSVTKNPGDGDTGAAPAAAAVVAAPEAGMAVAEMVPQPTEPYLYFIEPAYSEEGATWLANGNFSGPVRIRLLHPTQRHSFMTELSPQTPAANYGVSPDANVFVTRPVDPLRHTSHHQRQSHKQHSSKDRSMTVPPSSSHAAPTQHPRARSAILPCGMQACHISEQFEGSLRDTLHRTQPPNVSFAPAATMLHIALFHHLDYYDVGSIAVASVTRYSVDATVALEQWRRFRRRHFTLRCFIALYYFVAGSFFISVAICHGVLTRPSQLRPHLPAGASPEPYHLDARVIVWGVLDGFAYFLLGVVRFYHTRLGLGNLSKYMDTPISVVALYATCRVAAYVVCAGVGIFMAMIIALTPPNRGGVDWDRWSDLPYSRRVWISYLPRWTMVTSASIHIFFFIAIFLTNH